MPLSPSRILFEDEYLLAVNKLSGELVVRGASRLRSGRAAENAPLPLLDFLRKEYPGLRPLHRLDFETSGVVVFARTKRAFDAVLAARFRDWQKVYRALVVGRLPRDKGDIRLPLPARGEGTVPALTQYRVLEIFANSTFIEATISTGRHHQIRRHFAAIHHPLVLDAVYGKRDVNRVFTQEFHFHKFFLHACSLTFPHPITGEEMRIEAPLPRAFQDLLGRLRQLS